MLAKADCKVGHEMVLDNRKNSTKTKMKIDKLNPILILDSLVLNLQIMDYSKALEYVVQNLIQLMTFFMRSYSPLVASKSDSLPY